MAIEKESCADNIVGSSSKCCFLQGYYWNSSGYLVSLHHEEEPLLLEPVEEILKLIQEHNNDDAMSSVQDSPPLERSERNSPSDDGESGDAVSTAETRRHLFRVLNLVEKLQKAVRIVDKMKEKETGNTPRKDRSISNEERRRRGKVRALQEQKEALLKQQQSQSNEFERNDDDSRTDATAAATLRMVRTLNSVRAIFPIILDGINHPDRDNKDLVIAYNNLNNGRESLCCLKDGSDQKGKSGKQRCFFISGEIFDLATPGSCRVLKRDMESILKALVRNDELVKKIIKNNVDWNTLLPSSLEKINNPASAALKIILNDKIDTKSANSCDALYGSPLIRDPRSSAAYAKSMHSLRKSLESSIRKRFTGARLTVYGSCLSDLSLGKSSDVDLSLHLPQALEAKQNFDSGAIDAKQYERMTKNCVYQITNLVRKSRDNQFVNVQPVAHARVPVIKGTDLDARNPYCPDGSLNFDICFLNDIAVANSSLLREYSLVDERIKLLMLMVKRWTQFCQINNAADNTLSSYAWMIMVIFYCQQIGLAPNLQCPVLCKQHGLVWDPNTSSHTVKGLRTHFLTWNQVQSAQHWTSPAELKDVSVTMLLYGFFHYYAVAFPGSLYGVSICSGTPLVLTSAYQKAKLTNLYCIEDPFETFDSHCPHDLAMPCDPAGQAKIYNLMQQAERQLHEILLERKSTQNWIWSNEASSAVPKQAPRSKPKRQRSRGHQQQQQQGIGKTTKRNKSLGGGSKSSKNTSVVLQGRNGVKQQAQVQPNSSPQQLQHKRNKKLGENKSKNANQHRMIQLANGQVVHNNDRLVDNGRWQADNKNGTAPNSTQKKSSSKKKNKWQRNGRQQEQHAHSREPIPMEID